ncbi:MAG: ribonuclease HI family protein [Ardenticatenia bacterium]|nr:ribonuclease HI family protein [Ardenticatenia bacterium]
MSDDLDLPHDVHYLLIFDGGSKGNPGRGYGSYVLVRCDTGQQKLRRLEFGENITNNEAEYCALIAGLRALLGIIRAHGKDPRRYRLEVRGDSLLVVNQVAGTWKATDPRMRTLRDEAVNLLRQFGAYQIRHHGRETSVKLLGH